MISKPKKNKESSNLFSFLPSNILSEIDDNKSFSGNSLLKDSNVSYYYL